MSGANEHFLEDAFLPGADRLSADMQQRLR
jgi:hypothetical protein